MRKTVSITVSGQLFHIEEQGFKKLDAYLDSIRLHFASYEDKNEIVSDIEGRIAEHFSEKVTKAKNVISENDVDDLIAHMGTVKDFEEFEGEAQAPTTGHDDFSAPKRLYRDPDNQMIAGVASGIANYFGIDPVIVRLVFAASLLFWGTGVLVYILLWIVMPEAKTTSDKVEMRGQQLTLKRIEATIRENVPAVKERIKPGTLTRIIQFPFTMIRQIIRFIGRILRFIVPIIIRLIGFGITIKSIVLLFALTFAFIMLISNAWEAHMDVPVRELAGNGVYYTALISGYIAMFIPGIVAIMLGVSLMFMRNQFRFPIVIALAGVWVTALMMGGVTVAARAPEFVKQTEQYIDTHKSAVTKNLDVTSFESIEAAGNYDVRITTGTGFSAKITGTQQAVDALEISVEDTTLKISRKDDTPRFCIICLGNAARIDITTPEALINVSAVADASIMITGVNIEGTMIDSTAGSHIEISESTVSQTLETRASGGSRINLKALNSISSLTMHTTAGSRTTYSGTATNVTANVSAGSTIQLSGTGTSLTATVTSGSDLRAVEFTTQNAQIDVSSGADATVNVTGDLKGSAHAGGFIRYKGTPASVQVETDPSGEVYRMDAEEEFNH
jgi:phage shock protein PspC (stress-responsive transcriptional regulator)